MKPLKILRNGILDENPVLIQLVGLCSVLAVSTTALNSLAMGVAVIAVLLGSNIVISLIRNLVPDKIRIPVFIVVIATFVSIVQMMLRAYLPAIYESLGIFIPLIVVNCLILARAESFASKNGVIASIIDGVGQGLGFTLAITILGILREVLGAGTIFGIELFGSSFEPAAVFVAAPGAFILLGIMGAVFNKLVKRGTTN